MSQSKKYEYRIIQDKKTWTAEIVRRVTSKRTAISKSQDGFATEAEATAWGEKELESFLENLGERNKRDSAQRTEVQKENAARDEVNQQKKIDAERLKAESADSDDPAPESKPESESEFSAWKKSGWDDTEK